MALRIEQFFEERIEALDPQRLHAQLETIAHLIGLVERVRGDRTITHVEDLVPLAGMSKRALQRLFSSFVGIPPKWVIKRFRLQEASSVLVKEEAPGYAQLARSLGYADQAHFIRDFKRLVGSTPAQYRKRNI